MLGKVKSFSSRKGYGFITAEDGKDYFFHYSQLQMDGFKTIRRDSDVEFTAVTTGKGDQAENITCLIEPESRKRPS